MRWGMSDWAIGTRSLAAMSSSLEIRLLGPFKVFVGGRPADVTGPKRNALLALLALRRPVFFKLGLRPIPRRRAQSILIVLGLMLASSLVIASESDDALKAKMKEVCAPLFVAGADGDVRTSAATLREEPGEALELRAREDERQRPLPRGQPMR